MQHKSSLEAINQFINLNRIKGFLPELSLQELKSPKAQNDQVVMRELVGYHV